MRIFIIGLTSNHHSLYLLIVKVLKKQFKNITLLIRKENYNHYSQFNSEKSVQILMDTGREDRIIKRKLKEIKKHDILIFDEYFGAFHRVSSLNFNVKKIIYIMHNSNKYYQNNFTLKPKRIIDNICRNLFLKKVDSIITMGPNIKQYVNFNQTTKPTFYIPFDYDVDSFSEINNQNKEIRIVIPGMIDNKRRDYLSLLKFLEKFYTEYPNSKIRIKLLGRIVSKENVIVAELSDNINIKFDNKITYFRKFIPTEQFEEELINADYILSNVHVFNKKSDRIEIYGTTKESGISFIIYKYEKPAIVPEAQRILSGFNSQLIKFNQYEDLFEIFKNIEKNNINYDKLKKEAEINKKVFNKKVIDEQNKFLEHIAKR
jgi:hypothetical protein